MDRAKGLFLRLSHLWMDAGYRGEDKGGDWVEKTLGWTVEIVSRPRKPAPEEVLMAWALGNGPKKACRWTGRSSCHLRASWCCLGEVGSREDVLLDRPEQEDEQRLREAYRHERGIHLRSHDPCDGEAAGPCSVVFGQFLHAIR